MLLNPRSSSEDDNRKLKLNVDDTQPANYFRCGDGRNCKRKRSALASMYHDMVKCDCGKYMSRAMGRMVSSEPESDDEGGIFTDKHLSFLISDDLRMGPVVPGSMIKTLINLGITVTSGAKLRTVTLGRNDFIDFLGGCLRSSTPLTDLILRKSSSSHGLVGDLRLMGESSPSSSSLDSKKMIVNAWVRKSDCKLLFVRAEEDFVDFLFGLLIIPLGGVECLLGGSTLLRNIDNLYMSVANLIDEKYLKTRNTKRRLMKPDLPPNYLSKNGMFSLGEQPNPTLYFFESIAHSPEYTVENGCWMRFKDPKGDQGTYVKRPGKFLVHSNLTVISLHSIKPFFKEVHICTTDNIEVLELEIGLNEALNILKASLTSKSALGDGLSNQISEKLQAQEHRG